MPPLPSTRHSKATYTTYPMLTCHPLHAPPSPSQTRRPPLASGRPQCHHEQPTREEDLFVAQWRAEKEKQHEDMKRGYELAREVADANYTRIISSGLLTQ